MLLAVLVAVSFTMEAAANPIATVQDLGMAAEMSGLTSPVETAISHDLNVAEHKKKKYRGKIIRCEKNVYFLLPDLIFYFIISNRLGGGGGGGGSSEEGR
jgi:hypothetical protein